MDKTHTPFLRGRVIITQPRRGYRFSLDAVLLASWIEEDGLGLDLGAGFGPISLMLKVRNPTAKIVALDILEDYLKLLQESIRINKFSCIYPLLGDVRKPPLRPVFDFIFSNPPYLSPDKFRVSPKRDVAVSKYQILGGIEDFVRASSLLLKDNGRAYFILGILEEDITSLAEEYGLFLKEKVQIMEDKNVKFLMYKFEKRRQNARSLQFLMKSGGKYTEEMEEILSGEGLRQYLK